MRRCIVNRPSYPSLEGGSLTHSQALALSKRARDVTALLGARNRFALRLADHQRSSPDFAGWDRLAIGGDYLRNCLAYEGYNDYMMLVLW